MVQDNKITSFSKNIQFNIITKVEFQKITRVLVHYQIPYLK